MKEEQQYSDLQVTRKQKIKSIDVFFSSFPVVQFKEETQTKVPIHAIILAVILFLIGSVMISLGALMLTGRIQTQVCSKKDAFFSLCHVNKFVLLRFFKL